MSIFLTGVQYFWALHMLDGWNGKESKEKNRNSDENEATK